MDSIKSRRLELAQWRSSKRNTVGVDRAALSTNSCTPEKREFRSDVDPLAASPARSDMESVTLRCSCVGTRSETVRASFSRAIGFESVGSIPASVLTCCANASNTEDSP